jgi:hypothetical protein
MSYGSAPNPRMRKSGGGMIFIIILAIGAFLLFNNRGGPGGNQPKAPDQGSYDPEDILGSRDDELERQRKDILGGGGDFEGSPMPSGSNADRSGDWQIEDAGTKQSDTSNSRNSTTTKGDWSIEDVDGKKKGDDQFKSSNPPPAKEATPKSDGDWSIEDAGTKNEKTEKGDWAIEETNTDKDK